MNFSNEEITRGHQIFGLQEDYRGYAYFDSVFVRGKQAEGEEGEKEVEKDWSSFGIVDMSVMKEIVHKKSLMKSSRFAGKVDDNRVSKKSDSINLDYSENLNDISGNYEIPSEIQKVRRKSQQDLIQCYTSLSSDSEAHSARAKPRFDIEMKRALRLLKKFYKKLFKSDNYKIVQRRYVNCDTYRVSISMKSMLLSIFPQELVTDDLAYYTIGILGIKKPSEFHCREQTRREIKEFRKTINRFTQKQLLIAMQSDSLKVLVRLCISCFDDHSASILQQALDLEPE
ncbi:unnamed protein product [Moneuplotes crassus]|uniref:Uncharacterized protein n=1 Tax=Euplotes crassus TaxID=5936 RepID=A0AAD1Y1B6_EUPCR|nr:unnamed protein product [Moneuplotes crassus]